MARGIFTGRPAPLTQSENDKGEGNLSGIVNWLDQDLLNRNEITLPKLDIALSMTIPTIDGMATARECREINGPKTTAQLPQKEQPLGWRPEKATTHCVQINVKHHNAHNPNRPFRQSNNYRVTGTYAILPESCTKLIRVYQPLPEAKGEGNLLSCTDDRGNRRGLCP